MKQLLFMAVAAAAASASPITILFDGVGSGMLGSTPFTNASFGFTITSDTNALVAPSTEPTDFSTPAGTAISFFVLNVGSGTFSSTGDQAFFTHPDPEDRVGIWHFNSADWLTKTDPVFSTFNLQTNLGPITTDPAGDSPTVIPANGGFETSAGLLQIDSVSSLSFQEIVTAPGTGGAPPTVAPEPSTWSLLVCGIGGIAIGAVRRKRYQSR